MNEWFVEVLNIHNEWIRWNGKPYDSWHTAEHALIVAGLNNANCWYRIVPEYNDDYAYYGPCH